MEHHAKTTDPTPYALMHRGRHPRVLRFVAGIVAIAAAWSATAQQPASTLAQEVAGKGWLVYCARSENGTWDLYLSRPDGSSRRNITNTPDFEEAAPRFSPDSSQMLYRRLAKGTSINHDQWGFQGELVIAKSNGTDARVVGKEGEYPWATWSPDGRQLVCLETKGIKVVDLASGDVVKEMPRKGIYQQLFASPDGKWFCGTGNTHAQAWSIVRINAADGTSNVVHEYQNCTPDWFPDSEHVLFSSRPDGQKANEGYGWTQLWMAKGDATDAKLVYGEEGRHIYSGGLSPDSQYAIFTRCPKDGGGSESDGAPMAIMRMADAPAIHGESPEMRALHPDAKDAELVELPMGWEPHWTFADVGAN